MKQSEKAQEPRKRHLQLPGCYNLRELGGYTTAEGKQIRWRTLLRGDSLHRLPQSSQQALLDYGVKTIIDLRTLSEITQKPNVFSRSNDVEYLNLPLIDDEHVQQATFRETLFEYNCFYLAKRSEQIKAILEAIANSQAAFIIHCSAGKDRTGIIIALLLTLANVPAITIAQDYSLSAKYLSPLYNQIREQITKQGYAHMLASSPKTILDSLHYLDENYGGINDYLHQIGINSAQIESLKNMLVN